MDLGIGDPGLIIGMVDGPIAVEHPSLSSSRIVFAGGRQHACIDPRSLACLHGTFIAAELSAPRESAAPAICPGCTLLSRPIFSEVMIRQHVPATSPEELAEAIHDCIRAGARIVNLSVGLIGSYVSEQRTLVDVLDFAMRQNVLVAIAAGNQGIVGGSPLVRHHAVIPVAACHIDGTPLLGSNFGRSIGQRGIRAPGYDIASSIATGEWRNGLAQALQLHS